MKQVFVINRCHTLNDIAYCSGRIKEYIEANSVPIKDIIAMVADIDICKKSHVTLKKQLGHTQTIFYTIDKAFYIYHDIQHTENKVVVLILDETTTLEVVRALMHKPDFEIGIKGVNLFTIYGLCRCEYSEDL